ncbi:hypothetical protein Scep_002340 [Stephania cephalantha]|uniref:Uncharacterized protein n=1 Tax=Stephania cephalantha TaxID=152367 RepID=A0AAP0LDN9_9MAGN
MESEMGDMEGQVHGSSSYGGDNQLPSIFRSANRPLNDPYCGTYTVICPFTQARAEDDFNVNSIEENSDIDDDTLLEYYDDEFDENEELLGYYESDNDCYMGFGRRPRSLACVPVTTSAFPPTATDLSTSMSHDKQSRSVAEVAPSTVGPPMATVRISSIPPTTVAPVAVDDHSTSMAPYRQSRSICTSSIRTSDYAPLTADDPFTSMAPNRQSSSIVDVPPTITAPPISTILPATVVVPPTAGDPFTSMAPDRRSLSIADIPPNIGVPPTSTIQTRPRKQVGERAPQVEVCEICDDYSHSTYDCPYYPKYENYHYPSYASPQPDFFGLMPSPQIPQQSTSLEDMMKKLLDDQQRFHEELQQFSREFPSLQNLETQFIQVNVTLQNMLDEKELCNTQPISYSEENVNVDTLRNVEVNVDTSVENYWCQIESDISIAQNDDDEAAIEIGVISERPEEPQIESKENQPLVLVKPPTLPCIFVRPCKGVEVKERSRIFYIADTFVLDDHDSTYSFVLEVPNELRTLKEGMHAALPKAINAPFVVDISKGEGIT